MEPAVLRDDMVDGLEHESKAVVRSGSVAAAMRAVPRHVFVEDDRAAYADTAHRHLGTRVLSPSTAARLLEALSTDPDDTVLVVGAGVGYTPAVLAATTDDRSVHAVDIDRRLVYEARANLEAAGYGGVLVDHADGAAGLPGYAPFDRILVEAAAVAPPAALVDQLADGGRLVFPRGGPGAQSLVAVDADGDERAELGTVAFGPLLVEGEQAGRVARNRTEREDREYARRAAERAHGWEHDWIDWDGH
jgi:protein-L-isoaspartate(D-aspartate) O-methyltransferase